MKKQGLALETAMRPEDVAMVEAVDKRLEAEIVKLRGQNVTIKQVIMGRGIYLLFAKYGIEKRISSASKLAGKDIPSIDIYPNLFKRANAWLSLSKRQILFERVGNERYPIRIDFNSNSPSSVTLVG